VTTDRPRDPVTTNDAPGSILHDNKIVLDLTRRPTRKSFGLPDGKSFRSYQRTGSMLQTTIVLPQGTVETPAFVVAGATNAGGGANDHVPTHDPKYFDVLTRYPSAERALSVLSEQAGALGIDPAEISRIRGDLGTGGTVPQSRVLRGLVEDWLSVEVTLKDLEGSNVQLDYELDVDVFHNAAVDKVLQDKTMKVDLTRKPTREDLGFLPTYWAGDVVAEPGTTINAVLELADGSLTIPTDAVLSSSGDPTTANDDPQGTKPPGRTTITSTGSVDDIRAQLAGNGPKLGIGADEIGAAFRGSSGERVSRTLDGRGTSVYDVSVRVEATLDAPGQFAASLRYSFLYR